MSHAVYHASEPAQPTVSALIAHTRIGPLSPRARLLRFVCVGGAATLTQLSLLALFTAARWEPVRANAVALVLSSQVNFSLSSILTWSDTWDAKAAGQVRSWGRLRLVAARWSRFMGAILLTTLLNEGLYTIVQRLLAPLLAALLCSICIAALNFLIGDRLVFTRSRANDLNAQGVQP